MEAVNPVQEGPNATRVLLQRSQKPWVQATDLAARSKTMRNLKRLIIVTIMVILALGDTSLMLVTAAVGIQKKTVRVLVLMDLQQMGTQMTTLHAPQ